MAVGAFGALVDFGIANLLAHFFNMVLVYAGSISFTCAVVSNFIWNRYWTYPDSRSRPLSRQLAMFFAVNVAGIAIRIPILKFGESPLLNFFQNLKSHCLHHTRISRQKFHSCHCGWNCNALELLRKSLLDV